MAITKSFVARSLILIVLLSAFTVEIEARRKILRGRKTITRTYYRGSSVPAWGIVLLSSLGMIAAGGVLYVVMRKIIISAPAAHSYAPARQIEP